jgi:hypothetical protein
MRITQLPDLFALVAACLTSKQVYLVHLRRHMFTTVSTNIDLAQRRSIKAVF